VCCLFVGHFAICTFYLVFCPFFVESNVVLLMPFYSICQVALGSMNELLNADYNANNLPKGKLRSITVFKFFGL
jgi:hypothetical protein